MSRHTFDKYTMVIEWSETDGANLVTVPALSGCIADGRTRQEAVANAERIAKEWIETAGQLGRPVPSETKSRKERSRRLGSAIGELTIIQEDDEHLQDFREYME